MKNPFTDVFFSPNSVSISNALSPIFPNSIAGTLKIGGATQDDEAAAEVLTSLDLPNENDALELLYEMGIIELIIDENGIILTDENGNILTGK